VNLVDTGEGKTATGDDQKGAQVRRSVKEKLGRGGRDWAVTRVKNRHIKKIGLGNVIGFFRAWKDVAGYRGRTGRGTIMGVTVISLKARLQEGGDSCGKGSCRRCTSISRRVVDTCQRNYNFGPPAGVRLKDRVKRIGQGETLLNCGIKVLTGKVEESTVLLKRIRGGGWVFNGSGRHKEAH